jgi:hypothetical protein
LIRNDGDAEEMVLMRWGMPPPPRTGGPPVTNIRNTSSPHWRSWLKPENRCLVPANSFAEYAPEPNPETKKKDVIWFALDNSRPLFCFAGIWTEFKGDRQDNDRAARSLSRTPRGRRFRPVDPELEDPAADRTWWSRHGCRIPENNRPDWRGCKAPLPRSPSHAPALNRLQARQRRA